MPSIVALYELSSTSGVAGVRLAVTVFCANRICSHQLSLRITAESKNMTSRIILRATLGCKGIKELVRIPLFHRHTGNSTDAQSNERKNIQDLSDC